MSKFLRNITDGTLRCRFCGDSECTCMEDGETILLFTRVLATTEKATLFLLRKQKLAGGKQIPPRTEVWIPNCYIYKRDDFANKVVVNNHQINKMQF